MITPIAWLRARRSALLVEHEIAARYPPPVPIPDFQSLMLPVLRAASAGETTITACISPIVAEFPLAPEDLEATLPSGGSLLRNRLAWAKTYLVNAGLLEQPRRGVFTATALGKETLRTSPPRIDVPFLRRFSAFRAFEERSRGGGNQKPEPPPPINQGTPTEQIEVAHGIIQAGLRAEVLEAVFAAGSDFLEQTARDLMHKMGYGGLLAEPGVVAGGGRDGGIDVVVKEDALGLGVLCVQCKCYALDTAVGAPDVQAFAGALDGRGAKKGVFVTTGSFSQPAKQYADRLGDKRIILLNGEELARLMIEHNLGVQPHKKIEIKRLDRDFFDSDAEEE